jgi:hypothetical protein
MSHKSTRVKDTKIDPSERGGYVFREQIAGALIYKGVCSCYDPCGNRADRIGILFSGRSMQNCEA